MEEEEEGNFINEGPSVKIIFKNQDDKLVLDEQKLGSILLREDVRNKLVYIVSVAGAFRSGKSFLLNVILRYLESEFDGESIRCSGILSGFKWSNGKYGVTTGIHMWSEPFLLKTIEGTEVAILLMDTEGTRDPTGSGSTTSLFGLSLLISTLQVFNLTKLFEQTDFDELQLYLQYANFMKSQFRGKPFQKLMFLVRDWPHESDHWYGQDGGADYLKEYLSPDGREPPVTAEILNSCFEEVMCFLMSSPGKGLDCRGKESVDLSELDLDEEFVKNLQDLVPLIISTERIVPKKVYGSPITALELFDLIKLWVENFNSEAIPTPTSLMEVAMHTYLAKEAERVLETFRKIVDEIMKDKKLDKERFSQRYDLVVNNVLGTIDLPNLDQTTLEIFKGNMKEILQAEKERLVGLVGSRWTWNKIKPIAVCLAIATAAVVIAPFVPPVVVPAVVGVASRFVNRVVPVVTRAAASAATFFLTRRLK